MRAAAWLYENRTRHVRLAPFRRAFSQRVLQILVDIDRVGEAAAASRLFAYNRPSLFAFYDKDHGDRSGAPLRAWAEGLFIGAGVKLDGGPIWLLCGPRVLNFVFNPLSLYFGYGPDGALRGVIYQVNNTFGESHAYVAPVDGLAHGAAQHGARKRFHVSPFFSVRGRYQFRLRPPGQHVALRIESHVEGGLSHVATLTGRRKVLSDATLWAAFVRHPWSSLQVIIGIHWQAFHLWRRGARYHRKPAPPSTHYTLTEEAQGKTRELSLAP